MIGGWLSSEWLKEIEWNDHSSNISSLRIWQLSSSRFVSSSSLSEMQEISSTSSLSLLLAFSSIKIEASETQQNRHYKDNDQSFPVPPRRLVIVHVHGSLFQKELSQINYTIAIFDFLLVHTTFISSIQMKWWWSWNKVRKRNKN